jgi:hypothetical protein
MDPNVGCYRRQKVKKTGDCRMHFLGFTGGCRIVDHTCIDHAFAMGDVAQRKP